MKWTSKNIAIVSERYRKGNTAEVIGRDIDVSAKTIRQKMQKHRIKSGLFRPSWTAEEAKLVQALWLEGDTAAEIGAQIGKSRNAICGFINRHPPCSERAPGAGCRPKTKRRSNVRTAQLKPPAKPKRKHGPQPKNPFYLIGKGPSPLRSVRPGSIFPSDAIPLAPASLRIPLVDLESHHCRWPTHEENGLHLFCGAQCAPADCYCACHARARTGRGLSELWNEANQGIQSCA